MVKEYTLHVGSSTDDLVTLMWYCGKDDEEYYRKLVDFVDLENSLLQPELSNKVFSNPDLNAYKLLSAQQTVYKILEWTSLNELYIDNWSTCDTLTFKVKGLEKEYWKLSQKYIKSKDLYKRRLGIRIIFSYKNNIEYVDKIFDVIDKFYDEEEYYVNMAIAWLLCELMIYNREKTLKYLEHHNLNKFTVNKAISKCRDSYRVSEEDKEYILKYKMK